MPSALTSSDVLVPALAATSRTRASTSSSGNSVDGLTFGNSELRSQTAGVTLASLCRRRATQIASDEGDFGVRFGRRRRLVVAGDPVGEQLLRIERRNIGGEIGDGQRKIAGDAHIGPHADQFAIAHMRRGRNAQDLAGNARLAERRQPVGLAQAAQVVADAGDRAAQRVLDPLGRGGEIGLAVERRKNGAAHQGRAA